VSLYEKWAFMRRLVSDRRLSRADVAIAFLLTDLFNERRGYAWPSFDWLAKAADVDRATVARAITRLVALGYFQREKGGGRGRANRYVPNFGDDANSGRGVPLSAGKGAHSRSETVAPIHRNSRMDAHKEAQLRAPIKDRYPNQIPLRERRTHPHEGDLSTNSERIGENDPGPILRRHKLRPNQDLENYHPSPDTLTWAAERTPSVHNLTGLVLDKFRNHYLASGREFVNVDSAFRRWLSGEEERISERAGDRRDEILERGRRAAYAAHGRPDEK
jgi:hypothetical protein